MAVVGGKTKIMRIYEFINAILVSITLKTATGGCIPVKKVTLGCVPIEAFRLHGHLNAGTTQCSLMFVIMNKKLLSMKPTNILIL